MQRPYREIIDNFCVIIDFIFDFYQMSNSILIQYQDELAIGDQAITAKEWKQLVNAKSTLVKFRGQ
ncbi:MULTISPECIES: SNF2 helicase-associated domain-containing protein [unclassified Okeania]|uniref:SNF2 helicase-associated domain-containing protein n=1 Tax=unclassified Okeania TaxID=2634635 RepID=UPI0013C0E18F|nr:MULTISPECIES: SNF2 helicase-associated domain-containing protein [unclassified Okeania]NEQ71912.1 hypothetical protein [Okeania sp. SIO2C9]NES88456.1 hypothetical protein [Okeania sp. SIO2B9]